VSDARGESADRREAFGGDHLPLEIGLVAQFSKHQPELAVELGQFIVTTYFEKIAFK